MSKESRKDLNLSNNTVYIIDLKPNQGSGQVSCSVNIIKNEKVIGGAIYQQIALRLTDEGLRLRN